MNNKLQASLSSQKLLEEYGCNRAVANYGRTFNPGQDPNISVKSDFNSSDYFFYRQGEQVPENAKDSIYLCNLATRRVGICNNIISIMGDFISAGIKIVHRNKKIESFYQKWWDKIRGEHISERFSNYLFRLGNVFPYRVYGKIPIIKEREWSKLNSRNKSQANVPEIEKRRIPISYVFLNPLSVEILGGELATFNLNPKFVLKLDKISKISVNKLFLDRQVEENATLSPVPDDIINALKSGKRTVELNLDNISVYYYKKDDWDLWAYPMLYPILSDLIHLNKLNLADKCALDGAISNIRLWNLGVLTDNPQTTILPQPAAINKLRNILANNTGGGTMDLVWGPELSFKESNTQVHNFLGSEKYNHVMSCIYSGLGIPPVLTGQGSGGFNNNYISMRILIERLKYGRRVLKEFLMTELKIVNQAMKFKGMPKIQFKNMNVGDDETEKKLLIELMDRDIISPEIVLDQFDIFDDIERFRIKRNMKMRGKTLPDKAGPYHNPMTQHELKKIILQAGGIAPSEIGVKLLPREAGEQTVLEQRLKLADKNKQYSPKNPNGRPHGKRDSTVRKQRKDKIRTKASGFINKFVWANAALKEIGDIIYPALCSIFNRKNLREFTEAEFAEYELNKFIILDQCSPNTAITKEVVYNILEKVPSLTIGVSNAYNKLLNKFVKLNHRKPSIDEDRQIKASAYSLNH